MPEGMATASSQQEAGRIVARRKVMFSGDDKGQEYDIERFTQLFGIMDACMVGAYIVWSYWYRKKALIQTIEMHDEKNVHIC